MAFTSVDNPLQYFNTILWAGAGDSSARSFTGVGFQPDWVWHKCRTDTYHHHFYDVVRGAGNDKELLSSDDVAEGGGAAGQHGYLSSFDTDGFSSANGTSNNLGFNQNGENFVAWNWKAGGSASSNTDGDINSNVSVNTTAGLSIVSYTGNATSGQTIGHGLGAVPAMIFIKNRGDSSAEWNVFHQSLTATTSLFLNLPNQADTNAKYFNNNSPTSSVFTVGNYKGSNGNSNGMIAYCFAEKQGYSSFGTYQGNGNTNGTFVYTGFKPAFLIIKKTSATGPWDVFDNKRDIDNPVVQRLHPHNTDTDFAGGGYMDTDFLSNGFKLRTTDNELNTNGATYIYMALAESPFTNSSGVPNNAR